ncbi:MAG TPA: ATP-dependent metallopeptidase FtsH/Yme1/Tma family protein, partial [Brevibacterium sp.]|nr:ATP-dependent metallopeptidase FtsH/Yme1/Tma family protein [Brevibacterium sp.]
MNAKKLLRGPVIWVVLVLLLAFLGASMLMGPNPEEIDTSDGLELLSGDTVEQVEVNDTTQRVELVLTEDFEDNGDHVAFYYATPQGETVMEAIAAA